MPGGDSISSVPIMQPNFNWEARNLSQEFSTFKRICTSLLEDGPYSELCEKQKVITVLNLLGTAAYQLDDEFDYTGRDKDKFSDVFIDLKLILDHNTT